MASAAPAEAGAAAAAAPAEQTLGWLLYAGATDFKAAGRSPVKEEEGQKYPNIVTPTQIRSLIGVKISFVAAGPAAAHCLVVDEAGRLFTWGRNETGQLGVGNRQNKNTPTLVDGMKGHKVVWASGGKMHSLVVTDKGEGYAFGSNKHGQLGTGSMKIRGSDDEFALTPVKSSVANASRCAAGAEFSVWLCDGALYSAGLPQYGQLGHGTDHEYNAKEGSVKLAWQPQPNPKKIGGVLEGVKVTKVATGYNHTVCIDEAGKVYTWGNGGYGRLGHKEQKDEFRPKQVAIQGGERNACPPDAICAAGSVSSWVSAAQGQVYYWGKIKTSGDSNMYAKPLLELSGHTLRGFACGMNTFSCHMDAERMCVTWGGALYGELGYGKGGKKSSANPEQVNALNNMKTLQTAGGVGQTLFLVDCAEDVSKFPVWDPPEDEPEAATLAAAAGDDGEGSGAAGGKKRKGAAADAGDGGGKKGKSKKK